jgi:competence protein ComEA
MEKARQRTRKSRQLKLLLVLTVSTAIGALIWSWLFPPARPQIVRSETSSTAGLSPAAETGGQPAVSLADPIPIYLIGAVKNPGIYSIERGTYLYQLVEQAGGLSEEAAADSINLAMRLDENQLVRIPTRAEVAQDPVKALLGEAEASNPLIDLNKADEALLEGLPGIGPSTAKAIVEYRKKNGSFACIEDLMKVPGIKESRFNALKDLVIVRKPVSG